MSDEEWDPDDPQELEKTLELPSDDEVESSVHLSPDSLFCPTLSATSSGANTPRRRTPRAACSPRVRGRGRGLTPRLLIAGRGTAPVNHQCPTCGRRLKTLKGLEKHKLNHKLASCARRLPSAPELQDECLIIAKQVVEAMRQSPLTGSCSLFVEEVYNKFADPAFAEFVEVVTRPAVTSISSTKAILPGALKHEIRRTLHTCLSDETVQDERRAKLQVLSESADGDDVNLFLENFCLRLVSPVSAFIIRSMRESPSDPHLQIVQVFPQDFSSLFDQQTLHRIAGYSVKAILSRARQFKTSERWRKFREVVLGRLARKGVANPNPLSKDYWTALLSRKSMMFVSDETLNFFVEVAKVMCYVEAPDGCLSKSKVLAQVTSSPSIMALWGTLVGELLDEHDSLFLMRTLVLSLCGTMGKGIMLRRLNQGASTRTGRVSGVGLRARLCR